MEKIIYLTTLIVAVAIGLIAGYIVQKRDEKRYGSNDDKDEEA